MTQIQRYVDEPVTFLFWEIDEVIAMSACMFLGIMASMLFPMLIVAFVISFIMKKIKRRSSEGVMIHFLYWHGFLKLRGCPPSYVRELVG